MTDIFTKKQRSNIMSRIHSKNTGPERRLKPLMAALGFSYQPKMYGRPDFASRRLKIVVFVDGCFWHKCPKHFILPASNIDYWRRKINKNVLRDEQVNMFYAKKGWKVVRVWEHDIKC